MRIEELHPGGSPTVAGYVTWAPEASLGFEAGTRPRCWLWDWAEATRFKGFDCEHDEPIRRTDEDFVSELPPVVPHLDVRPTQQVPVLVTDHQLQMMKWGLVPFWAKERSVGTKMINARAEGIGEKPSCKLNAPCARSAVSCPPQRSSSGRKHQAQQKQQKQRAQRSNTALGAKTVTCSGSLVCMTSGRVPAAANWPPAPSSPRPPMP